MPLASLILMSSIGLTVACYVFFISTISFGFGSQFSALKKLSFNNQSDNHQEEDESLLGIVCAYGILVAMVMVAVSLICLAILKIPEWGGGYFAEKTTSFKAAYIDQNDYALIRIYSDRLVHKGITLNSERNKIIGFTDDILIRTISDQTPPYKILKIK